MENHKERQPQRLAVMSVAALGVVYGDIGTSPLYALRECFRGNSPIRPTHENVLGVLSLIFWSLIVVVGVKYLVYVMRADNHGEGGILALLALLNPWREPRRTSSRLLIPMGIFGAALLYGDGMITPAISVLSAVEGLTVATPIFEPYIVPITVVVLFLLFSFQSRGTQQIGRLFGPVMLLWFGVLALLGITGIYHHPSVLQAVNPAEAVHFFAQNGWAGFAVLGSVFLVVTGGEALYADMGHFGRAPIRLAWFALVLPALQLNYFGQAAVLLESPNETTNPFFQLAPNWALYPMVVLSTLATVIASQAVITGAFSLTSQAILLGRCPRLRILHTSRDEIGQIYIPFVNWILMLSTMALVFSFRSSGSLAGAYGVAVSTTMVITTILAGVLARRQWKWSLPAALLVSGLFLAMDFAFFGANLLKIADGGLIPLTVAVAIYNLMAIWGDGRQRLGEHLKGRTASIELLLAKIQREPPHRIPGTAVFMTSLTGGVPPSMWHHLKHNQVLHERVLLVTINTEDTPWVRFEQRVEIEKISPDIYRVIGHFGFMQVAYVPGLIQACKAHGLELDAKDLTFYVGRETVLPRGKGGMAPWRERIFAFLSRNQARPTQFYRIPPEQVVELGIEVAV